jgi:hypothetical protein
VDEGLVDRICFVEERKQRKWSSSSSKAQLFFFLFAFHRSTRIEKKHNFFQSCFSLHPHASRLAEWEVCVRGQWPRTTTSTAGYVKRARKKA